MASDHLIASHLSDLESEYSAAAERFLAQRLNTSYAALEAEQAHRYDAALYWRFLYEQYGDMAVLRAALEEMACREVSSIPATLDAIMDATFARLGGEFANFQESVVAFAQANYALRLVDGRCAADDPACRRRHRDPNGVYTAPLPEAALQLRGSDLAYEGAVPASYGSDLIEVLLEPDLHHRSLQVTFRSGGARFDVRLWRLRQDEDGALHALTPEPEALWGRCSDECVYTVRRLDLTEVDRLALIVVRLDPNEAQDPYGRYTLTLDSR
jgi:hypothetical protein